MPDTPLYIVASPRPRVGKTTVARLLLEFLQTRDRPLIGYDLNPREPSLAHRFPNIVSIINIADTRGQMALFDRLIGNSRRTAIIDLGYGPFDQFFAVMAEIGFVHEARRRAIEPIVLFIADPAPASAATYIELRRRLPEATFVPVHNESVTVMFSRKEFPPSFAEGGVITIARLSPIVRGVIDRPSFAFSDYVTEPPGGPTEMHTWTAAAFAAFRELELRLLMGRLSSALGTSPTIPTADSRRDR